MREGLGATFVSSERSALWGQRQIRRASLFDRQDIRQPSEMSKLPGQGPRPLAQGDQTQRFDVERNRLWPRFGRAAELAGGGAIALPPPRCDPHDMDADGHPTPEFIARMVRWSAYRWQPPRQEPVRDARLAALFDPVQASLEAATSDQWAVVKGALEADTGWLDAYNAVVATATEAGRGSDVAAGLSLNHWKWPHEGGWSVDDCVWPDEARFAAYAVFVVAAIADTLEEADLERLLQPWLAAFPRPPWAVTPSS